MKNHIPTMHPALRAHRCTLLLLVMAAVTAFLHLSTHAADITFEWDRNPEPEVLGYTLWEKTVPVVGGVPVYTQLASTGATVVEATVKNITAGTHTYVLTAWAMEGTFKYQSPYSEELVLKVPKTPAKPNAPRFKVALQAGNTPAELEEVAVIYTFGNRVFAAAEITEIE